MVTMRSTEIKEWLLWGVLAEIKEWLLWGVLAEIKEWLLWGVLRSKNGYYGSTS